MRVTFETFEPFLEELCIEAARNAVWMKQVRFQIVAAPEQAEEISFKIGLVLTAIIDVLESDSQFIFEAVVKCGVDDKDLSPPNAGTEVAKKIIQRVQEAASKHGIELRQGKFEAF